MIKVFVHVFTESATDLFGLLDHEIRAAPGVGGWATLNPNCVTTYSSNADHASLYLTSHVFTESATDLFGLLDHEIRAAPTSDITMVLVVEAFLLQGFSARPKISCCGYLP